MEEEPLLNYTEAILEELDYLGNTISNTELSEMADRIIKAKHIFISGAGRSGIMATAFVNRLMHLGISVSKVGDTTSPHSSENDLLLVCTGSGETGSLVSLAHKAKEKNVDVVTITTNENSTIAKMSQSIVKIPAPSKDEAGESSIQPMGSLFEQSLMIILDSLVLQLMEKLNETSKSMFERHADFE